MLVKYCFFIELSLLSKYFNEVSSFRDEQKNMRWPGIEPGSSTLFILQNKRYSITTN